MAVKTVRNGLNRETRALLEYIRRVRPVNRLYGARPDAQAGTSTGYRGVNPGVTPGFKAALTAAINVGVIQGLSPALTRAMSSGLSAAVNRAQTGEFRAAISQESNAALNPAMNRAPSPAASSGLTSAFSRELSPALNGALSPRLSLAMSAEVNAGVPVRVPCPAAPHSRNFFESRGLTAGLSACASCVLSPSTPRLFGEAAAFPSRSKGPSITYM